MEVLMPSQKRKYFENIIFNKNEKKAYYEILKNFTKQKILNFKLDFFRLDQNLKNLKMKELSL